MNLTDEELSLTSVLIYHPDVMIQARSLLPPHPSEDLKIASIVAA